MRFSLINVDQEYDGMVDGVWIQNHTGTLESATQKARETEQANSNRITVAVVEALSYTPDHSWKKGLKRLDSAVSLERFSESPASGNAQYEIDDHWLHHGQKVKLLNKYFQDQIGTVQSFVWNTGEYIVTLENGHDTLFKPSELEPVESNMTGDLSDLTRVLKAFDKHGWKGCCTEGNWKIASGGYDLWFELYYAGDIAVQCIDGELSSGFRFGTEETERMLNEIVKVYGHLQVKKPSLSEQIQVASAEPTRRKYKNDLEDQSQPKKYTMTCNCYDPLFREEISVKANTPEEAWELAKKKAARKYKAKKDDIHITAVRCEETKIYNQPER